jgi:tetratricopeptide (TPR) repeat protein
MEDIKAFVGHSFTENDAKVVRAILNCLDRVAELHPRFSWKNAEHPEPSLVDHKVLALFADKNLFIGICTRKEKVIAPDALAQPWYNKEKRIANDDDFQWKTSDWVIQEIGLAIGRGLQIIILLEEGVRIPGALQGNLEFITFNRNAPEKCFDKLLGMLAALTPAHSGSALTEQEIKPPEHANSDLIAQSDKGIAPTIPQANWEQKDYELGVMRAIASKDADTEKHLTDSYFASKFGTSSSSRNEWAAWKEYVRLIFGAGGKLERLSALANDTNASSRILNLNARAYLHFEEYGVAAKIFVDAVQRSKDITDQISWLGEAAWCEQKAGNTERAIDLINQSKALRTNPEIGERELLKAEKNIAELTSEGDLLIGTMERLLELNPEDNDTRFSLAYQYSEIGLDSPAVYHYIRIPTRARSAIAWNNLGVAYQNLNLPIKSVNAYREAEKQGETLAMSNLARKFMNSGFQSEAQTTLQRAIEIKEHHQNIERTLSSLNDAIEDERNTEVSKTDEARKISEYFRDFGEALSNPLAVDLSGPWQGPNCTLALEVSKNTFVASGNYEVSAGLGLLAAMAIRGSSGIKPAPSKFHIEYKGSTRGCSIKATVRRKREGESESSATILGNPENSTVVLMWVESNGKKIHVMERSGKGTPSFYELVR